MPGYRPSLKRKREPEDTEPNLIPIMNLMVVLIPLILSVAQLTELSLLEYLPPAAAMPAEGGGNGDGNGEGEEAKKLDLKVNLVDSSIQVSIFNTIEEGPNFYQIPLLPNGQYDWVTLSDSLMSIKENTVGKATGVDSALNERVVPPRWERFNMYKYKDGREISIFAMEHVPFQEIVFAMDNSKFYDADDGIRKELFPVVVLKTF